MAGLADIDIKLDKAWQLTQASTGDAPVCTGIECFLQDIQLEAITQPGEIFYDAEWGWGLASFLQAEDDDLTRLEITERVKKQLRRRQEIKPDTVEVSVLFVQDTLKVNAKFQCTTEDKVQSITVALNRVNVEVSIVD